MSTDVKKILKISGFSVFFILILVFIFFRSHDLLFGVKIKNVNIVDGQKIPEDVLKITGNAKNAVFVTLNGREISISKEGDFDETVGLLVGYNVISIQAKDKFGYSDEKNYKLMH